MGREHARKWKHFLLHLAAGLMAAVLLPACMTYSAWQGREKLKNSDLLMKAGDYGPALAQTREVYRNHRAALGDEALFRMGLLYAHPENPASSPEAAIESLEKLFQEFPQSPLRNEAEVCAHILRSTVELNEKLRSLEATYEEDRETLSQLEKEMGEKEKKIARYHRTATSRKAAIEELKTQISELQSRLENLEAQLSDLKKIDLEMEEKRRKGLP